MNVNLWVLFAAVLLLAAAVADGAQWSQMGLILLVLIASGYAVGYGYGYYRLARKTAGKVDELRAKIAEFEEKGINTDELERVLAECEAEMGTVAECENEASDD